MNDGVEISPFNINYGHLDKEHVELLKKQIEAGNDIPIRFYKENGIKYVIDGGHAFSAYTELKREPPYQIEVPFTTPEDMIALSRHCNVNRMQQAPVSYAESIVKEVKLRLKIEDEEVKSEFIAYETAKNRGDASVVGDAASKFHIIEAVFDKEKGEVSVSTFRKSYLSLLDLPDEVKREVNKGEIGITHADALSKVKKENTQREIAKAVKEDKLTVNETKEVIERVENKNESIDYAVSEVLEEKARKRREKSPEHKRFKEEIEERATENTVIDSGEEWECPICHKKFRLEHIEPNKSHRIEEIFD